MCRQGEVTMACVVIFISVHHCSIDEDEDGDDEEVHEPMRFDLGACPHCRGCGHRKGDGFGVQGGSNFRGPVLSVKCRSGLS